MGLARTEALWLARGAALGTLMQRLLDAGLRKLRDLSFAGEGLPKGL